MVTVEQTQEMFNSTVDEAHTFYVGNNGWLVHNTGPCGEMALDANALIQALDFGKVAQVDAALGGKAPVISITAVKEYLKKGSIDDLRAFLSARGGRIGAAGSEADVAALRQLATQTKDQFGNARALGLKDARVVASAMKEDIPVVTQDKQVIGFLNAIYYPHVKW